MEWDNLLAHNQGDFGVCFQHIPIPACLNIQTRENLKTAKSVSPQDMKEGSKDKTHTVLIARIISTQMQKT